LVLLALLLLAWGVPALGSDPPGRVQPKTDWELLSDASCPACSHAQGSFELLGAGRHWLIKYNPLSLALSGMLFTYQRFISPQWPSDCIYEHSCSSFSKALIEEYGLARGTVFTADRLTRCNRIAILDVHPLSLGEASGKVMEGVGVYKKKKQE
jgi:putative component of membrane protein insertase Oxa1/YidC/SpoIIIJ protein YidD/rubredoxin